MISRPRPKLSKTEIQALTRLRQMVKQAGSYEDQLRCAKALFKAKNKAKNPVFKVIRAKLLEMTDSKETCHYCEHSEGSQIEHFHPEDVFPERVFMWSNYLWVCSKCNIKKSNHWAGIDKKTGKIKKWKNPTKKPEGFKYKRPSRNLVSALVDPVLENPMDFFFLDISPYGFAFTEYPQAKTFEYIRAKYSLEVFPFDKRAALRNARESAYMDYLNRLMALEQDLRNGLVINSDRYNKIKVEFQNATHRTVWLEMLRQKSGIPELVALLNALPLEVQNW